LHFQQRGDAAIAKLSELGIRLLLTRVYGRSLIRQRRRSAIAPAAVPEHLGNPCPGHRQVRWPTATFGRLIERCCRVSDIGSLARTIVKLITLSGSTARCDSGSQGECAVPCLASKSSNITLAQSGISFITTAHPYNFRSTFSPSAYSVVSPSWAVTMREKIRQASISSAVHVRFS